MSGWQVIKHCCAAQRNGPRLLVAWRGSAVSGFSFGCCGLDFMGRRDLLYGLRMR